LFFAMTKKIKVIGFPFNQLLIDFELINKLSEMWKLILH